MISVNTENSEGQDEKFSFLIFYITLQLTKSILLHPQRILVFMDSYTIYQSYAALSIHLYPTGGQFRELSLKKLAF